jgi:hypothetical protein
MKKVALTLASIAAIATFAPEASAIPAFARQTGMACSACHFQHFPLLNGFGRAFKSGGFTMMGAQGKVEGEHLDIPDRVNMAIYTTGGVAMESAGGSAVTGATGQNQIFTPGTGGEFSLFMGGRGSDFAGFIAEAGLGGNGTANSGGVVGATKTYLLFPVGDSRVGLSLFSSNSQGAAYSFETLNTGNAGTHKLMGNGGPSGQHVNATSAAQYMGVQTAATGASVIANNSMGFINIALYEQAGNSAVAGANSLNLNYMRGVYNADIAGLDMAFGVARYGGESTVTTMKNDLTLIDFQAQGELAGKSTGIYASYGTAAASSATAGANLNHFNASTTDAKTSLNVAATVEIIEGATIQAGYRNAKDAGKSDNAMMIGGTYDLAQNIALGLNYTVQSGDKWSQAVEPAGKTATTLLLEALF